ncbi:TetR/AcrR family transcriptional regulator [Pseudomonadota bacterium]
MPYSPAHKEQSRNKLLASAFELFAHQGYDKITLNAVTEHAGLTRGAFYNHFSSKQELYREAMKFAATNSQIVAQMEKRKNGSEMLISMIEGYLSQQHLSNTQPCPLAFLVTDMANQEPEVRASYTHIFENITHRLTQLISGNQRKRKVMPEAQALAALLIGGVAVGRALDNEDLTNQVMNACRILAKDSLERVDD